MSVCDKLVISTGTIEGEDLAKFVSERVVGRNDRRNKMILSLHEHDTTNKMELICRDLQVTEGWHGKKAHAVVESLPVGGVPEIRRVIFNNPATIVLWGDSTKTVVKCQPNDTYDKRMGLALCIAKKALGNKGNYNKVFDKWIPEEPEQKSKYEVGDKVRCWTKNGSRVGTIVKDDGSDRMQYVVETNNGDFWVYGSRKESINGAWYIEGLADE